MKVVIINNHRKDFLGGSETQCDLIAENLIYNNIDVVYYAIQGDSRNIFSSNYKISNLEFSLRSLYLNLKSDRPDIVYWRYGKNHLLKSVLISKLLKIKFIFAVSGPGDYQIFEKFSFKRKSYVKKVLNFFYIIYVNVINVFNYLGFFLCNSAIYQLELQTKRLPCNSSYLIYNSCQNNKEDFEWNKKYIVWVSNIKANKNPDFFLELAEKYKCSGFDFLMVGKIQDSFFNYIEDRQNHLPNFFYLGPKSLFETNAIIQNASFLVHTCSPEGFPNVFIQAWNFGVPTVSLFYDPDFFISQNNLGFFSKEFSQFVTDVGILMNDHELLSQMGQNAISFSNNNFCIDKNIHKLILVFNCL